MIIGMIDLIYFEVLLFMKIIIKIFWLVIEISFCLATV